MKASGFNIEKIHLKDIQRIEKLVLLVIIAFMWWCKVGIHLHEINQIQKKGKKSEKYFQIWIIIH